MNRKVIKRVLEEMKVARLQVMSIEQSLENIIPGFAKDTVVGSSPEFPYTAHPITIEGHNDLEYEKLVADLKQKQTEWYHKIRLAERALREAEPEMQDMLRRYYENGQTMEQIGEATGYTKGRVSQKLKEFFE
ncbi:hypothetical protein NIA71_01250 [Ihubacter massiliensis]|uniref:sigma factor-like helix-turn-helix DNA-binding protein n=1 Tax=Ihubacter massiliensis TaxID=1852367 RepID=UPI002096B12D|nr:hypothetical protein [Clostridia bacterium]MCO7120581.1 hypothetical protein [Ihubacter massiliensis]MDY3010611.1 sigma factor-like helix-turn-helix DNA-binding protein [Clostridiales Family XIII bacterium]